MEKLPYLRFAKKEKKKSIKHKKAIFSYKQRKVQLRPEMYIWDYSNDEYLKGFAVAIVEGNKISVMHFNEWWENINQFDERKFVKKYIEQFRTSDKEFKFHCTL